MRTQHAIGRASGFSIIELLIAMTIGLFLTAGAIEILVSHKRAYTLVSGTLEAQDSGRFATRRVGDFFRMAGHRGGVILSDVSDISSLSGTGVCQAKWLTANFTNEPLRGYEGGNGIVDTGDCATLGITDANHVDDSDVLVIRYGEAVHEPDPNSAANQNRLFIYTVVSGSARLGLGSQVAQKWSDDVAASQPDKVYGRYVYPYYTDIYYVRPWTDSASDGIPALLRLRMDGETSVTEVMVSGVEQMKVEFGVDSDSNDQVDRYLAPDDMASTDWPDVMSARLAVVTRSIAGKDKIEDENDYYLLAGPNKYVYGPPNDVKQYARMMFEISIHLRNTVDVRQASS